MSCRYWRVHWAGSKLTASPLGNTERDSRKQLYKCCGIQELVVDTSKLEELIQVLESLRPIEK